MLLLDKTKDKYGYDISALKSNSHSLVVVQCDYCNDIYDLAYKTYNGYDRSLVNKDGCKACKFLKRKDISIAKYGVSNSAQRQDVKDKISAANADRLRSDEFKEQAAQTNLEKYGYESAMQSDEVKERLKKTMLSTYGVENISQHAEKRKIATKHMMETRVANGTITLYDGKTRPDIAKDIGFSRSHFGKLVVKYGIDEAIKMTPTQTTLETYVENLLKSRNVDFVKQQKIANRRADFVVGDIVIEADGLYWHSDAAKLERDYHVKKRKDYINAGYKPLFFRENELYKNPDIVMSVILNKLKMSTKLMARKCRYEILEPDYGRKFLQQNHLMGAGSGICHALLYDDEVVSVAQIKNTKDGPELSRFCNKIGLSVTGAMSKLIRASDVKSLITFIDLRYGDGSYLSQLGFTYQHEYISFKWTDGKDTFNRMKFPGRSGYEKGLYRIWDCGQAKWVFSV